MRHIHAPIWLHAFNRPTTPTFVTLYTLEAFSRASLVTVIPLIAYQHLGDAQKVSLLYFGAGLLGLCSSFAVPWLVNRITRRGVLTLGAAISAVAMTLFALNNPYLFMAGMALHLFGGACMEVSISLYLMDHVPRNEIGRFEPVRLFYSGLAWTIGPWLGVFLKNEIAIWTPFVVCGAANGILLGYFWYLRMTDNPAVSTKRQPVTNPLKFVHRFVTQPRLLLAWSLAVGRAGWWGMFFIYTPIYVVSVGLGENVAGALSSLATLFVMAIPLIARYGRRIGTRRMLVIGYTGCGCATIVVSVIANIPWVGVAVLCGAALLAVPIDSVGNTLYLRAVHPYERAEMTTVFSTYRYSAQLVFPGVFAILLNAFALPAIFAAAGSGMVALGLLARKVPKGMQ